MSYIATGSLFNCLVWYIKHPVSSLTAWISARIQHIAPIGKTTNNLHVISGRDLSRQIILHHCFSLSDSDKINLFQSQSNQFLTIPKCQCDLIRRKFLKFKENFIIDQKLRCKFIRFNLHLTNQETSTFP